MPFVQSVLCLFSELCLSQERVNALFPRIQEKKSIVVAKFLIWGFKAHHMLRLCSGALRHNRRTAAKIHVVEETIHPERSDENTSYTLRCLRAFWQLRIAGDACLKSRTVEGKVFILRRNVSDKNDAQVQPAVTNSSVFAGGFIGHHVCFIGHFDFPASGSTDGGEGVSLFHLLGRPGSCLGRPAAGLHGALRPVPHPSPQLCGGLSPAQLLFNRGLQRRAGH